MKRLQFFAVAALFLVLSIQGCNTLSKGAQGASQGFKEDWKKVGEADGWMKKNWKKVGEADGWMKENLW